MSNKKQGNHSPRKQSRRILHQYLSIFVIICINLAFLFSDGIQSGQFSFYRPLLVILDRHVDLATPMHHTWTYQVWSLTYIFLCFFFNYVFDSLVPEKKRQRIGIKFKGLRFATVTIKLVT